MPRSAAGGNAVRSYAAGRSISYARCPVSCHRNARHAGRSRSFLNKARVDSRFLHEFQCLFASWVVANGCQQRYIVTQPGKMKGEVQGRSPQVFGIAENVPKNFTDTQNSHF